MMADWVMQVSFQPRMVAVSFENDARTLENLRSTGAFSLNLLSEERASMALAAKFAQPYYDQKVVGRVAAPGDPPQARRDRSRPHGEGLPDPRAGDGMARM